MKKIFLFTVLSFLSMSLYAQKKDTVLKDQTIEVIQSYKPVVKQAPKPVFSPDLPPADTTHHVFQYDVPQQVLSYSYTAMPIRPLALGKDSSVLPFSNYVKFGGGNLSTVYLDAGIGQFKGESYNTAIHLHHLQQQGELKYQRTAFTGLEANGSFITNTMRYNGGIDVLRNQYALYGGYTDTGKVAPKNVYTGVLLSADAMNEMPNAAGIDYHPAVKMGLYGRVGVTESMFNLSIPASKKLDDNFTVSASVNLLLANQSIANGTSFSNNIFQFIPKIAYEKEGFKSHIGIKPTAGRGGNSYILPDLYLNYKIPNALFNVFAGWDGTLQQNTFQQLTSYNPYLGSFYTIRQTRQDEVFGGLAFGLGNSFNFSGKISYRDYKDFPMFLNHFGIDNSFFIQYDDVKAVSVEATLRYDIADIFNLKLSGAYYNYFQHTNARVFHEPALRFNADFSFRPFKDITFTAYSRVLDGIYAVNEANITVKNKAAFDVGLGGEYRIIPRMSLFLNINNLFNNKYQRWYNYEAYGFTIFGGLRVKF